VLKRFTDFELLADQNAYECEKCCAKGQKKLNRDVSRTRPGPAVRETRSATKRYLIHEPPTVLTLHLKRFEKVQNGKRVATKKFHGRVDYPLVLDVAPFCSKDATRVGSQQNKLLYRLYGVVSHSGGLSGGHYVAYVRGGGEGKTRTQHFLREIISLSNAKDGDKGLEGLKRGMEANIGSLKIRDTTTGGQNASLLEEEEAERWYFCNDNSVSPIDVRVMQRTVEAYILFYERVL